MSDIILHHYPQSPVAEKVRKVLGIKNLRWHSVEIPRIPPKPDLMPLTGGYRRTPVMQIGADVYCDSQCIIRELDQRFPEPGLFPNGGAGVAWGISRWTDGPMFTQAIAVVLGAAESLPADFAADRGRLYFGPDFTIEKLQDAVAGNAQQLRGQFDWFEQTLREGMPFLSGNQPGLIDALAHYLVWFIGGRWSQGQSFLEQFPYLLLWRDRVEQIGHGQPAEMFSQTALGIAKEEISCLSLAQRTVESKKFKAGEVVNVVPDVDGGDPAVSGELVALNAESISISSCNDRVGEIVIHFPNVGYRIV